MLAETREMITAWREDYHWTVGVECPLLAGIVRYQRSAVVALAREEPSMHPARAVGVS